MKTRSWANECRWRWSASRSKYSSIEEHSHLAKALTNQTPSLVFALLSHKYNVLHAWGMRAQYSV